MSDTPKFQLNQQVVYPCQGVGKIKEISEKKFKDNVLLYYVIDVSEMTIMVPVSRAETLGIRPIASEEEASKALEKIAEGGEAISSDWKERYQKNQELLKKGNINDIVAIVRASYNRSKVKELPILERKLYEQAKKLLIDEFAIALGKSEKEIEQLLHSKLEPLGQSTEQKHSSSKYDNDDEDDGLMDDENDEDMNPDDDDDDSEDMEMDE